MGNVPVRFLLLLLLLGDFFFCCGWEVLASARHCYNGLELEILAGFADTVAAHVASHFRCASLGGPTGSGLSDLGFGVAWS